MPPRALELRDLPKFPRYRSEVLSLDSRRVLTQGNPLRARNFLAYLNPKRRIYTGVDESDDGEVLGGVIQRTDESFARLAYLAPANIPFSLIDHLVAQAGAWRAHHIIAEIGEENPVFQSLRQCGFAVYGRQRIWDLSYIDTAPEFPYTWRKKENEDFLAIQSLQKQIVPSILQQVETFTESSTGMLPQDDELLAYIDITYGPRGIYLRPLIHHNIDHLLEKLSLLLANFPNRRGRPISLCVRSHQAWIEPILEDMGARMGAGQAVMVKHLTNVQRETKPLPAGGNTAWVNPAAPINGQQVVADADE